LLGEIVAAARGDYAREDSAHALYAAMFDRRYMRVRIVTIIETEVFIDATYAGCVDGLSPPQQQWVAEQVIPDRRVYFNNKAYP
jgi:hypothetical protein